MSTTAVVAVFANRKDAYEAAHAIKRLEVDDVGVSVSAGLLVGKDAKGNVSVLDEADRPLWGTGTGMLLGGLIGLIAGPMGAVAGAAIGGLGGMTGDAVAADIDDDFAADVTKDLSPSDTALLIEAEEVDPGAIDAIIRSNGGRIHRAPV